jgi:hypothetical protein
MEVGRSYHFCVDIKGALRNWTKKSYKGFMVDDEGRTMSFQKAKLELIRQLQMGRRVMPAGDCDNFDYQTGCKGHDKIPPTSTPRKDFIASTHSPRPGG